jgi:hypothetical protein
MLFLFQNKIKYKVAFRLEMKMCPIACILIFVFKYVTFLVYYTQLKNAF